MMRFVRAFRSRFRLLFPTIAFAAGFLAISWFLHVSGGEPIASRTDVFFQSDAGGIITDALSDNNERARGTHPFIYPLWTWPLHRIAWELEPWIDPRTTVTLLSRILVAFVAGFGLAKLLLRLREFGVRFRDRTLICTLLICANGMVIAAIPDHFGLSVGILSASFAAAISKRQFPKKARLLVLFTILAGGITVTNAVFPATLLIWQWLRWWQYKPPRVQVLALAFTAIAGIASVVYIFDSRPHIHARVKERVELYLNWRITRAPENALCFAYRGVIDCVVAPTPTVTSVDNLDNLPMLTYEPFDQPYECWPYDAVQSTGAVCWLTLLIVGTIRAARDRDTRGPTVILWGWVLGNALFHNFWGDEYFLYTPHFAWALIVVAVLGWRDLPWKYTATLVAIICIASLRTLAIYRALLDTIPQ